MTFRMLRLELCGFSFLLGDKEGTISRPNVQRFEKDLPVNMDFLQ